MAKERSPENGSGDGEPSEEEELGTDSTLDGEAEESLEEDGPGDIDGDGSPEVAEESDQESDTSGLIQKAIGKKERLPKEAENLSGNGSGDGSREVVEKSEKGLGSSGTGDIEDGSGDGDLDGS